MSLRMSEAQARLYLGKHYTPPKPIKKPTGSAKKKQSSQGEELMALQLRSMNIEFTTEFKFCDTRKWRADFRILNTQILVEVEGGIHSGGRHTRGKGYEKDMEKYNWATANGWLVHRFSTEKVKKGEAIKDILALLSGGDFNG